MNGEAAVTMMHAVLKLPHDPHPWTICGSM